MSGVNPEELTGEHRSAVPEVEGFLAFRVRSKRLDEDISGGLRARASSYATAPMPTKRWSAGSSSSVAAAPRMTAAVSGEANSRVSASTKLSSTAACTGAALSWTIWVPLARPLRLG